MQQAISEWWALPMGTPGKFYGDEAWNPAGTPPSQAQVSQRSERSNASAPVVPWYTARWMSNPSCRGYPWY